MTSKRMLRTSQTMRCIALSFKNNTPLIKTIAPQFKQLHLTSNNCTSLKTKVTMVNQGRSAHYTLLRFSFTGQADRFGYSKMWILQDVDGRQKCRVCERKTSFKCKNCSSVDEPIPLCSRAMKDGVCWEKFHAHRTFDVQSSQSQNASQEELQGSD